MRQALCCAAASAMIWLSLLGAQTTKAPAKTAGKQPQKAAPKAPVKGSTAATHKSAAPVHKSGTTTAARKGTTARKSTATAKRPAVTWRNRQSVPTPDRYREIQSALAERGYLSPEQATGAWDQASIDALKRFQQEQNLDSTGKINSLSLIALGLGPKRDQKIVAPKPQLEQSGQ